MNVHACREPGVMNLYALDFVREEKMPPAVMHVPAAIQNPVRSRGRCDRSRQRSIPARFCRAAGWKHSKTRRESVRQNKAARLETQAPEAPCQSSGDGDRRFAH